MNPRYTPIALMIGALMAGATLPSVAQARTTLTLSNWVPPSHYIVTDILEPWAEEVEAATEGRVGIRILPSAIGAPDQHWELARKGIADVTWGNFTYEPERFKSLWFAEMPLSGSRAADASVALWDTYERYLADEATFDGVKVLGMGMLGGGAIHHQDRPVIEPQDLEHQKIRMGGPIQKQLLEAFGAVPVAAPATQAYELLESGVVDGSLNPLESVTTFRLEDQLSHHTLVPGGFYDATFFIAINERKWNSLPEADREAILSVSGEHLSRRWGERFDAENAAAEATLREAGHHFHEPSEALMAKAAEIRDGMLEAWAADVEADGIEAPHEMVEFYRDRYRALDAD